MRNQKGFTLVELFVVLVLVVGLSCWVINAWKLSKCDFESNYRCEVIHGFGILPVLAPLTVWFDTDK